VTNTPLGGEPRFFISVTCGFFKQSTAASAYFSAGSASNNGVSASFLIFSALSDASVVFLSYSFAISDSYSAIALSFPTFSIKTSVSAFFYSTSTILIYKSFYSPSTFDLVSARILNPY